MGGGGERREKVVVGEKREIEIEVDGGGGERREREGLE